MPTTSSPQRPLSIVERQSQDRAAVVSSFRTLARPSLIATWWRAHLAVRSGMRIDEFLRGRMAAHELAACPDDAELPQLVDISLGRVIARDNTRYQDPVALVEPMVDPVVPELRAMRALPTHAPAARELQRRIRSSADKLTTAGECLVTAHAERPAPFVPPTEHTSPEPRPLLPSALPLVASGAAAALLVACEGFQFALPFLDSIGVNSRVLASELNHATTLVLSGFAFAFSLSLGLLITAHVAVHAAVDIEEGALEAREILFKLGRVIVTGMAAVGGVLCAAAMRHGISAAAALLSPGESGDATSTGAFSILGLVFTLAAAILSRTCQQAWNERQRLRMLQREWDAARAIAAAAREAILADHTRQHADHARRCAELEANVRAATTGLETLIDQACSSERQAANRILLRETYARAFVKDLVAALNFERSAFVRQACRAGRAHLLEVPSTLEPTSAAALTLSDDASGPRKIAR